MLHPASGCSERARCDPAPLPCVEGAPRPLPEGCRVTRTMGAESVLPAPASSAAWRRRPGWRDAASAREIAKVDADIFHGAPHDRPAASRHTARIHVRRRQAVDRRLRHLGVGQAGWLAITAIAKAKSALSQIELAHALGVEGPSLVSLIDRLVKSGLVERHPSETDRRVKHVLLTEAGRELYANVKSEAALYRQEVLNGLDRDRLLDVTELLETLQSKIEEAL